MADLDFIPDELSDYSDQELLDYFDNPKNFEIPDIALKEIVELESNSFPKHATVLLTHGLFSVNSADRQAVVKQIEDTKKEVHNLIEDRKITRKQAYRLLSNFSDI